MKFLIRLRSVYAARIRHRHYSSSSPSSHSMATARPANRGPPIPLSGPTPLMHSSISQQHTSHASAGPHLGRRPVLVRPRGRWLDCRLSCRLSSSNGRSSNNNSNNNFSNSNSNNNNTSIFSSSSSKRTTGETPTRSREPPRQHLILAHCRTRSSASMQLIGRPMMLPPQRCSRYSQQQTPKWWRWFSKRTMATLGGALKHC